MLKIPFTQHEFLALDTYFSSLLRKKADAKIYIIGNPSPYIIGSREISEKNLIFLISNDWFFYKPMIMSCEKCAPHSTDLKQILYIASECKSPLLTNINILKFDI